jgi:hypothetical protein
MKMKDPDSLGLSVEGRVRVLMRIEAGRLEIRKNPSGNDFLSFEILDQFLIFNFAKIFGLFNNENIKNNLAVEIAELMLKRFWTKFFPYEGRSLDRYPIQNMSQCFINSQRLDQSVPVYMGDISEGGLSFFFKKPWFDINDQVDVVLVHNSRSIEMKAQIVAQKILYPQGSEDLKLALYRYSVQFSDRLNSEWVGYFASPNLSDLNSQANRS